MKTLGTTNTARTLARLMSAMALILAAQSASAVSIDDVHCYVDASLEETHILAEPIDVEKQIEQSRIGQSGRFIVRTDRGEPKIQHEVLIGMAQRGQDLIITVQSWKFKSPAPTGTEWDLTKEVRNISSLEKIKEEGISIDLIADEHHQKKVGSNLSTIPLKAQVRCH